MKKTLAKLIAEYRVKLAVKAIEDICESYDVIIWGQGGVAICQYRYGPEMDDVVQEDLG